MKINDKISIKEMLDRCKKNNSTLSDYLTDAKYNYVIIDVAGDVKRNRDGEYITYPMRPLAKGDVMVGDEIIGEDEFLKEAFKYYQVINLYDNVDSPFGPHSFMVFSSKEEAERYNKESYACGIIVEYSYDDIEEPTFISYEDGEWKATPTTAEYFSVAQ